MIIERSQISDTVKRLCTRGITMIAHLWGIIPESLEQERARWALWIPVALSLGIGIYFSLPCEPDLFSWSTGGLAAGTIVFLVVGFFARNTWICFLAWGLFWGFSGFLMAMIRTHHVHPHLIAESIHPAWISGVVENIDHPASAHALFQRIVLCIDPPGKKKAIASAADVLPKKAMITIRTPCEPLLEGDHIRLKAQLMPLPGPCFPGSYDPRRQFFFQGIGASGFALSTPRIMVRHPKTFSYWRHTLTRKLHSFLAPPLGAMACGLVTGDKIALPSHVRQEFGESGLAHLLAIAGLHMSILSGLCFMVFQRTLARIPNLALYVNLDRIAAFLSLCVGWVYLMISGQRYPVQRAFFMMAATMLSMIVGRRRHSMRILMLCAATFLIFQPESLLSLSFQLSFAAVGGLISIYEWRMQRRYSKSRWKPWKKTKHQPIRRFVQDSMWSTGSITMMTFPIMIHHFYHVSLQGFLSNMIAIPFTAAVIMPVGIVALISMATPWAGSMMTIWGWSLQGLMWIASFSARYGAWMIGWFRPHDSLYFAWEMLGICWLLLWQKRWRWWGLAVWILATILGHLARISPTFLIDRDHHLMAYVDGKNDTLWVTSLRRGKWTAQRWSQAFGTPKIRLWPNEKSECVQLAMPWCSMLTSKKSETGPVEIRLGDGSVITIQLPRSGCIMLDRAGQSIGPPRTRRPWDLSL